MLYLILLYICTYFDPYSFSTFIVDNVIMIYFLVHFTTSGWQIRFVSDRLLLVFRKEKNRIMFLVQCFDILNVNKYH